LINHQVGENIIFDAKYSLDLATMFYEDFARENTRINIGRDLAMFLLGNVDAPYYSKLDLEAKSKTDLFELCQDYELIGGADDLAQYIKRRN